ncbi:hypothetical protein ACIBBB_20890 [Streptomyces sp. NPDC051217]|uniref:hypothetical protein n=1 Tax=Streptomyces sp. NPDC051217 TaxID=3365644 RepID=UPI00379BAE43
MDGEIVSFTSAFTTPGERAPRHSDGTLRFPGADRLGAFLAEAGLVGEERYGDRDRAPLTDASPEIITIARRTPA